MLAAMSAGVAVAQGRIIVFMDDDAIPKPDWLSRILSHLADPTVGGAGGRDIVTDPDSLHREAIAGKVGRWGRLTGNHHLVTGAPRSVEILKGANMAFRREALALPQGLLGDGAQVHNEIAICLHAKNQGWTLILDPAAEVLHLPGPRFDADSRSRPSAWTAYRTAFNLTWGLGTMRPHVLPRRLAYGMMIGDRPIPGIARALVGLARGEVDVVLRLVPSLLGQIAAAGYCLSGRRLPMVPAPPLPPPTSPQRA
jgi:GT2 family glycosyltransferase